MQQLVARRSSGASSSVSRSRSSASSGSVDPVQRARKGYKDRWHRNNVEQRQVAWPAPLPQHAHVAVIGGGVSGLATAQGLARHGLRVTVFDTGVHGPGGRCATRTTADGSIQREWLAGSSSGAAGSSDARLLFDHAAQCFTATDAAFQAQVRAWLAAGVVQQWRGPVGVLRPGGDFEPLGSSSPPLYVASAGMRALAQHMADEAIAASAGRMRLVRPMWVSRMTASPSLGGWTLSGAGNKALGTFDAVVIAHNGKCANRLVGPTGTPAVATQLMRLRLSAVWALLVAFDGAVPLPVPGGMQGAFVQGSPVLAWAANNSAKLGADEGLQCFTLISTSSFGSSNKVPQERVPPDVAAKVAGELLEAFAQCLGLSSAAQLPRVAFSRCQLWGAALPLNSPRVPCILDPLARVGVAGDWLTGASIQSAWLSGAALAERLARLRGADRGAAEALAVGLHEPFVPLAHADIGEFPGVAPAAGAAATKQHAHHAAAGRRRPAVPATA